MADIPDAEELQRRVDEVLARFSEDLQKENVRLAANLDAQPEIQRCLRDIGVTSIGDLTPEQRAWVTRIIFGVMELPINGITRFHDPASAN